MASHALTAPAVQLTVQVKVIHRTIFTFSNNAKRLHLCLSLSFDDLAVFCSFLLLLHHLMRLVLTPRLLPVEAVSLDLERAARAGQLVSHLLQEALERSVLRRDQARAELVASVVVASARAKGKVGITYMLAVIAVTEVH